MRAGTESWGREGTRSCVTARTGELHACTWARACLRSIGKHQLIHP